MRINSLAEGTQQQLTNITNLIILLQNETHNNPAFAQLELDLLKLLAPLYNLTANNVTMQTLDSIGNQTLKNLQDLSSLLSGVSKVAGCAVPPLTNAHLHNESALRCDRQVRWLCRLNRLVQ